MVLTRPCMTSAVFTVPVVVVLLVAAPQDQEISIQLPEMATRMARISGRIYVVSGIEVACGAEFGRRRGGRRCAGSTVSNAGVLNYRMEGDGRKGAAARCYHGLNIEDLQEESRPGVMRR